MTVYRFRTYQPPEGASDDQRKFAYASAQRQMSHHLYEILMNQPLPAVVDIKEEIVPSQLSPIEYRDVLEIQVKVTPVQHQHIVFAHADGRDLSYTKAGMGYHLRSIWNIMWRKLKR